LAGYFTVIWQDWISPTPLYLAHREWLVLSGCFFEFDCTLSFNIVHLALHTPHFESISSMNMKKH
jgi:hypothetical protein